jgi:phosphoribosylaminoimidazolecarboxamide formyltransferase/IMP cyclohydrolase
MDRARRDDATPYRALSGELAEVLRYGENPHQEAAFYRSGDRRPGVATATQLQGKAFSFNNLNDTDAAFELVAEFDRPHAGDRHHQARQPLRRRRPAPAWPRPTGALWPATRSRPSAASWRPTARSTRIRRAPSSDIFTEVIVAPDADEAARQIISAKKNLRPAARPAAMPDPRAGGMTVRSLSPAAICCSRATTPGMSPAHGPQGGDQAPADRSGDRRPPASPLPSASTSSRTPSSTSRTVPRSASAPGR